MVGGRKQLASFHSDFYRDYYHKTLNALMLSCLIILLLISSIIYIILFHKEPNYYASTTIGQIIPMQPAAATR